MHSSRMRTVRSSGHLEGGSVCPGECLFRGCLPMGVVHLPSTNLKWCSNLLFGQSAWKWRNLDLGAPKIYYVDPPLHTTAIKRHPIHSDGIRYTEWCMPNTKVVGTAILLCFPPTKFRHCYFIVTQHLTEIYVQSASWISLYFLSYSENTTPFGKSFWKPTLAKMDTSYVSCT